MGSIPERDSWTSPPIEIARSNTIVGATYPAAEGHLANAESSASDDSAPTFEEAASQCRDVVLLLPQFRRAAHALVGDSVAADKLVELALERAIAAIRSGDDYDDLEAWLTDLLEDTFVRIGPDLRRLFIKDEGLIVLSS